MLWKLPHENLDRAPSDVKYSSKITCRLQSQITRVKQKFPITISALVTSTTIALRSILWTTSPHTLPLIRRPGSCWHDWPPLASWISNSYCCRSSWSNKIQNSFLVLDRQTVLVNILYLWFAHFPLQHII